MNEPSSIPPVPDPSRLAADVQMAEASVPPTAPPALQMEPHDPYAALRLPDYRKYFVGNALSLLATQMVGYTVGYELYRRTGSTLVLGLIGLAQIIPIVLLTLPAGHMVDRFDRKRLVLAATSVQIILFLIAGWSTRYAAGTWQMLGGTRQGWWGSDPHVAILFTLLFLNGMCRSINQPAKASILPMLVPARLFSNAVTWNSSLFEISNVAGPTIAGFMIAGLGANPANTWAYTAVYWTYAACQIVQWINMSQIRLVHALTSVPVPVVSNPMISNSPAAPRIASSHPKNVPSSITPPALPNIPPTMHAARQREPMTLESMLAGVRFVASNKVILGIITLDLFAVLLGGATALLPAVAEQVLKVGPVPLAFLRAAPSVGAISTAMMLAHRPMQKAGRNLLWSVTGFGVATVIFGLSNSFWLSILALIATGAFDNISVIVRSSLVQLYTPDEMRGRVNAVNSVFIATSNELGAFESGGTAWAAERVWGPARGLKVAITAGGIGTMLVVMAVARRWPQVGAVKKLDGRP